MSRPTDVRVTVFTDGEFDFTAAVFAETVNKRERKSDIKWVAAVRTGVTFAGFKSYHLIKIGHNNCN